MREDLACCYLIRQNGFLRKKIVTRHFQVAVVCQKLEVSEERHFCELDILNVNIFIKCVEINAWYFLSSVMYFIFFLSRLTLIELYCSTLKVFSKNARSSSMWRAGEVINNVGKQSHSTLH